jgi:uncharacterized protein
MRILLPVGATPSADPIADILRTYRTVAVVGLSSNEMRPSYGVAEYLHGAGYRIIPVNPNEREVLGEKSYARLTDVPGKVEIVDVFRRSELVKPTADEAVKIGAKVLWMQIGVVNDEAAKKAQAAGLLVVMDACLLVEHKRRREVL